MISLSEWRAMLDRLRDAIGCPVDWGQIIGNKILRKNLRLYWAETARGFQASSEMDAYDQFHVAEQVDEEALRRIEINAEIWRPRAEKQYREKCGFIEKLHYVTPQTQAKHYSQPQYTRDKCASLSKYSDALFYPEITEYALNDLVFDVVADSWRRLVDKRPAHVYGQGLEDVGCSKGAHTRFFRLDFDYSNAEVHGHPIKESEKPAEDLWLSEYAQFSYYEYEDLERFDIDEKWVMPHRDDLPLLTPAFDKLLPKRPYHD